MEKELFVKKDPVIYIVCGKARHGKDTVAECIREIYGSMNKKILNLQYSTHLKNYAKVISNWDGSDETKPRELLQQLGTSIIRKQIDEFFFVNRIVEDIRVYSYFYDAFTVSDARAKVEVDIPKQTFAKVVVIHVIRPNFDNGLTEEQKKHFTEIDLDGYANYDYEIINDGTVEDLTEKVIQVVKEVEKNEH